jgi:hypothetical protein
MLNEYCNSLSDEAQLQIATRLGRIAYPLWDDYFFKHPQELNRLNSMARPNRIIGAQVNIDQDLPLKALERIEQSYAKRKGSAWPVADMKSDVLLYPVFTTIMQPLAHPDWDNVFTREVKLAYTSVWNILTWILSRRITEEGETHISVAINQAADALMSAGVLKTEQIEKILMEYQEMKRKDEEDTAWTMAPEVTRKDDTGAPKGMDEIFGKIIGEKNVTDPPQKDQAREILRQMKEEGKSYWDKWEEYYNGTCKTYSYDQRKKCFWYSETDVIVGSFFNEYSMTEQKMYDFISGVSLDDLRESGFLI